MYANIHGLHKNLSDLSLLRPEVERCFFFSIFCSETLSLPDSTFSGLWPGNVKQHLEPGMFHLAPMQLLRGEVDLLQGLAVYVRDGFSA